MRADSNSSSEAPLGRRERNKQEKLRRIKVAALALFKERGYERTTTLQVADRADISEGTLFFYAKTKEDILTLAMSSELLNVLDRACATVPWEKPFPERVAHIYVGFLRYHGPLRDLSRYFMRGKAEFGKKLPGILARTIAFVEQMALAEQKSNLLRPSISAHQISWVCWSLFFGAFHRFLRGQIGARQSEKELRAAYQLLFEGLRIADRTRALADC